MSTPDDTRDTAAAPSEAEQQVSQGVPNPETGAGLGAGESSSFEPEEAPDPER